MNTLFIASAGGKSGKESVHELRGDDGDWRATWSSCLRSARCQVPLDAF